MPYHLEDIRKLADLLEAEVRGLPFDRDHARQLAHHLADIHPHIGNSMRQLAQRLSGTPVGDSA